MGIFGKSSDARPDEAAPQRTSPAAPQPAPTREPSPSGGAPTCLIGAKTVVKGEISGDEDVLVAGTVEGQVRIKRDLRVAPGGVVRASVEAHTIVVSGEVAGDCAADVRVEIQATGRLTGNIRAPKIVIAEGAMFKGNSDMSGRRDERKDKIAAS
jgi:cytoskeletal protein CcmA (bactofilin family)